MEVGNISNDHLHMLSCYAPTYAASRKEKGKLFDTLQQALDVIPAEECYINILLHRRISMPELDLGEKMMKVGGIC